MRKLCERYARWVKCVSTTMRQEHRAGEKCFMDFSGDAMEVHESVSGEVRVAKLYVAVLGASNYTYVEPVFSEDAATTDQEAASPLAPPTRNAAMRDRPVQGRCAPPAAVPFGQP